MHMPTGISYFKSDQIVLMKKKCPGCTPCNLVFCVKILKKKCFKSILTASFHYNVGYSWQIFLNISGQFDTD